MTVSTQVSFQDCNGVTSRFKVSKAGFYFVSDNYVPGHVIEVIND